VPYLPPQYSHDVKVRLLALSLVAWVAGYAWVYVEGMRDQGSTPYWWYLAIIGAGTVPPMLAAAGLRSRSVLICGAAILGGAAIPALPSTGMLLLPGVVAAAALAVLSPPRKPASSTPGISR
jgi:predicted exporter